jgi:hypothetical protein
MPLSLRRTLTTLGIVLFLIVMLGTAGSQGFFGDMFEGLDMFGDMFGSAGDALGTSTTGSGSRPLPTPTVRR